LNIFSELEDTMETINTADSIISSQLVSQLNYHLNNSLLPTNSNTLIHRSLEGLINASNHASNGKFKCKKILKKKLKKNLAKL